jgi:hypothetical protein
VVIVKTNSVARWAAVIVLLTWLAIEVHELGHFTAYTLFGYHARMSLQRVTPIGDVPAWIDHWAKFAGPAVSLIAGAILLAVAHRRHSFGWVTASFTNASLRLFPCVMDLLRATRGARPFSDEGEVALAFSSSPLVRSALILVIIALALLLTIFAAREYRFQNKVFLKSLLVYFLSLSVGIGVVILDELLGWSK